MNKKTILICGTCLTLMVTSGCTNPLNKQAAAVQSKEIELIEVENSDYTYSYKTPDGNIVLDKLGDKLSFNEGLSVVSINGKYGLVDKSGKYVVEPIYYFIGNYSDGMYAFFVYDVTATLKAGYFNSKGEVAIDPIPVEMNLESCNTYDYNFYNGVALYRQPETYKFGFIDKKGNFIVKPIYSWAEPFTGKYAAVTEGNNYGYIDTAGKLVIPYKFVLADKFSDGMASVYDGKAWGYIDETGNYAIQPQFGSYEGHDGEEIANPFIDGYAAVYLGKGQTYRNEEHQGQFALIDKTGKILNNQKYDSLELTYLEPGKPSYVGIIGSKYISLDTKGHVTKVENY